MKVTLYVYEMYAKKIRGKVISDVDNFEEDLICVLEMLMKKSTIERKEDMKDQKKIIYLNNYTYVEEEHILMLEFKTAKYDNVRTVVDTDTLTVKASKKKGAKDGDEETTRMIIRFSSGIEIKNATSILQGNSAGASITKIVLYLNEYIHIYHRDCRKDSVRYKIVTYNKVSNEFLKALGNAKRICGAKFIVDQEDLEVSEFKDFSGLNDIKNEVGVFLRPSKRGVGISVKTIEKIYKQYNKKDGTVKRIVVDTRDMENNPLSFDTEKIKEKIVIDVNETNGGEPEPSDVVNALRRHIIEY